MHTNINGRDQETVASNTHTHTHILAYIAVMIHASHNPSAKFDESFEFL